MPNLTRFCLVYLEVLLHFKCNLLCCECLLQVTQHKHWIKQKKVFKELIVQATLHHSHGKDSMSMCFGLINAVPEKHRKNSGGYKIKTRKVKTPFLKTTSSQRDKTTHRFGNDDHLVTHLHSFVKRNNLSYCNNHLLNAEEVLKEKNVTLL